MVATLDWLAGIVDGEGCIALLVFKGGKRGEVYGSIRLQMRVTVANTNEGVINRIIEVLTGHGIGHHIQTQQSKVNRRDTGRVIRLVHISTKPNILKLLKLLEPRLAETDKQERARLIIKLIEQREAFAAAQGIRATHCYTQEDVAVIMDFLKLTRSKQTEHLAKILNEQTREARKTITKKSRARHDVLWTRARAREASEMNARP